MRFWLSTFFVTLSWSRRTALLPSVLCTLFIWPKWVFWWIAVFSVEFVEGHSHTHQNLLRILSCILEHCTCPLFVGFHSSSHHELHMLSKKCTGYTQLLIVLECWVSSATIVSKNAGKLLQKLFDRTDQMIKEIKYICIAICTEKACAKACTTTSG